MKPTPFNLTLLLLLLTTTSSTIAATPAPVVDLDGHPLQTRSAYYILQVVRGNGGGLSLGPRNDSSHCPLYVIQENNELSRGLPARFHPANPNDNVVRLSTDMNVEFDAATVCAQSTVWRLGGVEGPAEVQRRYVKSGGVAGNPGIRTVSNWFKIEKDEATKGRFYKMVFCPSVCSFCKVVCGDVGVFREDGRRFLGLAPQLRPLLIAFKKAA